MSARLSLRCLPYRISASAVPGTLLLCRTQELNWQRSQTIFDQRTCAPAAVTQQLRILCTSMQPRSSGFLQSGTTRLFESEPVQLNHADLFLDRTGTGTGKRQSELKFDPDSAVFNNRGGGSGALYVPGMSDDDSDGSAEHAEGIEGTGSRRTTARAEKLQQVAAPLRMPQPVGQAMRKKYSQQYIWGQLNGWFKQTVYDPAATLSAERRGTLSLPDVESAYGGAAARYDMRVCFSLLTFRHRQYADSSCWQLL